MNEMLEESGMAQLNELQPALHLRDDLNMDSFMLAELTVKVEQEFGIDIFEEGLVQTVGEVLQRLK